ncbi:hypothetical protein IAE30_29225 [Pantoea sp. S61]|uniref:hypothetical protein n=1 Tax=Pantoea sp. S61 TaxID=2767442 RepID=UPI00190D92A8|nr:hypothetical protein [Pantoea sp. S61]MBK0127826.1 hypothetical protein [Pantoea sp. S61]
MKNPALNRGVKATTLWQRFTQLARKTHAGCITWAARRGLPDFAGRLPVPLACITLISVAIACGLFIGAILLLISALAYMLCNISLSGDEDDYREEVTYGTEWRNGDEGTGIYTGPENGPGPSYRIDTDDYDD